MKAFRIISTEYCANTPSVFLFVNGEYYGCRIYPSFHKFPQDVNFWREATCSDADRFFSVEEVHLDDNALIALKQNHTEADEQRSKIKKYVNDYETNREIEKHNRQYERELMRLWEEARNIILGLIPCKNEDTLL